LRPIPVDVSFFAGQEGSIRSLRFYISRCRGDEEIG